MKLMALCMVFLLTGCGVTHKMDIDDLSGYKVNCANAQQQLDFLQTQMPSRFERMDSYSVTSSLIGTAVTYNNGTYDQYASIRNGEYAAVTRLLIEEVKRCDKTYTNPGVCDLAFPDSPACRR